MLPAFLIRVSVDAIRHDKTLQESNPYSRCEAALELFITLWQEQFGKADSRVLEPDLVTSYWDEFFHSEDPLPDENEWREGLAKRASRYDSFSDWQDWFKQSYAKVYKENNIWMGILMTAWAHTHQFEVRYTNDKWEFREARSYLPTSQVWRLEPHIGVLAEIFHEFLAAEIKAYERHGFVIQEETLSYLGDVESLGFDTRRYSIVYPSRSGKEPQVLEVGEMIADVITPAGDNWYRQLDNVIFAENHVDVTALTNRVTYVFKSKRRLAELLLNKEAHEAKLQASAEGWLVSDLKELTLG
jgi:hypothetical protein